MLEQKFMCGKTEPVFINSECALAVISCEMKLIIFCVRLVIKMKLIILYFSV